MSNDYEVFLKEWNLTEEAVQEEMKKIPVLLGYLRDNVFLDSSDIAGIGLFAYRDFAEGEYLGKGAVYAGGILMKTEIGRFINHSFEPNCIAALNENSFSTYALKEIKKGEELLMDYSHNLKSIRGNLCQDL